MKKHLPTWLRTLASTIATVYFFSNVVLAYTPEKNLWAERRRHIEKSSANQTGEQDNLLLASLPAASSPVAMFQSLPSASRVTSALSEELAKTLPLSVTAAHAKLFSSLQTTHGTIRKVWLPAKNAGDRVVVHIQDVHQNQDAQRHIGGAIESLLQSGQAGVVGLEGGFAPIDVKAYHDYKNREVIGLTADYLLKENLITGPVHTAMTTPAPLAPMVGVDDPVHYNANVEAYRQSAPKIDTYKKAWEAKKYKLAEEKKNVFSPALLSFDAKVETYHARGEGLAEYVEALAPVKGEGHAGLLAQAFEMEKALDFTKVELDRKSLIDVLVKSLTQDQINQLVQESTSYRVGQIRYAEFYTYLKDLCRGAHVDLANYPHMDAYIRYVLLSDRIDGEKLLTELSNLEKARFGALVKTENEKSLVTRSRAITLAGRLLSFELSPEEWADYVKINADESLGLDMASFEAFYKEAHARDESLTANLLKAMDDGHHKTAVLVTGGYHTDGVSERLTRAGVTVVTFTPRVETLDTESGSTYLSIFTQEKTPLEKLFAGEKLFMSQNPMAPATQKVTAPAVTAAVSALAESPEASKGLFSKLGGLAKSISSAVEDGVATVIVWGQEAGQAVKVVVSRTPGGLSVKQTVAASLSVATIALAITAFVVPMFAAITTAAVSLTGVLPGVSLLSDISASLVSLTTGQLGNTILATLGVPYTGFNLTSTAEITKYVFAATFLILMAGSVGRKFVVIAGGRTSNQNRSQSPSREGLTLVTEADLNRDRPVVTEPQDNEQSPDGREAEVVGRSPYGFPHNGKREPKKSDFGFPQGEPLFHFLVTSTILLALLNFPIPAYAAGFASSFGSEPIFLWGFALSGIVLVTVGSLTAFVFVMHATKMHRLRDSAFVGGMLGMLDVKVPASVINTLLKAPAKKEVAVITLLNMGSLTTETAPRRFIPAEEMTDAINRFQAATGRKDRNTPSQSTQYAMQSNLPKIEMARMKGYDSESLAGIIRLPVINENPERFEKPLAESYIVEASRVLVKGGILHFWVPNNEYVLDAKVQQFQIERTEMIQQLLTKHGFTFDSPKETKGWGTEFVAVKKGTPGILGRISKMIDGSRLFLIVSITSIMLLFAPEPSIASPSANGVPTSATKSLGVQNSDSTDVAGIIGSNKSEGEQTPGEENVALSPQRTQKDRRNSANGPGRNRIDPEKDAKDFLAAIADPKILLDAVVPVSLALPILPGSSKEVNLVTSAPDFAENMAFFGYKREDGAYLRDFNKALVEELTKNQKLASNLQLMTILNTLLGGVTIGSPLAGDTSKMTIIEATVNTQAELNAIVQTAKDIERANDIMGSEGPGIRLALSPSSTVNSKKILDALKDSGLNSSFYHVKNDPRLEEGSYTFDEYVLASKLTMSHFSAKATGVNLQFINAPNISNLNEASLSGMRNESDELKRLLAESLLAWFKTGDRWFTIESFNTMFEAAILAAQSA